MSVDSHIMTKVFSEIELLLSQANMGLAAANYGTVYLYSRDYGTKKEFPIDLINPSIFKDAE